jgi:hypothetical protein
LWKRVIQQNRRELPASFHDLTGLDAAELRIQYNLPSAFIDFVLKAAPSFELLRNLRVGIEHSGHGAKSFQLLEDGLGVDTARLPWRLFPIWSDQVLRPNGLGCYLALNAWVANEMLKSAASLERAIAMSVPLPPPVTDWSVFLRSPFCGHLKRLKEYRRNPWVLTGLASQSNDATNTAE